MRAKIKSRLGWLESLTSCGLSKLKIDNDKEYIEQERLLLVSKNILCQFGAKVI